MDKRAPNVNVEQVDKTIKDRSSDPRRRTMQKQQAVEFEKPDSSSTTNKPAMPTMARGTAAMPQMQKGQATSTPATTNTSSYGAYNQSRQQPTDYNRNTSNDGRDWQADRDARGSKYDRLTTIQKCAKQIERELPNIIRLQDFFLPYDCFQGRKFEDWELQEMFPDLTSQDIKELGNDFEHDGGRVMNFREVCSFDWLHDKIQDSHEIRTLSITHALPQRSIEFCGQIANDNVAAMMDRFTSIQEISNYPAGFFEKYFGAGKVMVTLQEFINVVKYEPIQLRASPEDYSELCSYLNTKRDRKNQFTKLMFCRAVTHWKEMGYYRNDPKHQPVKRSNTFKSDDRYPQNAVRGGNQSFQRELDRRGGIRHDSFSDEDEYWHGQGHGHGPSHGQGPSHGFGPNRDHGHGHGHDYGYADNRGHRHHQDDRDRPRNPQKVISDKGDDHHQHQLPDHIQVIIEKVSKFMTEMKSRSLVETFKLTPERIGSTQCVKKNDLLTALTNMHGKGLLLEQTEIQQLVDHFTYKGPNTTGIDYINYHDFECSVFDLEQVFQKLVDEFPVQLQAIREALRKRFSGVYKWFSSQSSTGRAIKETEFSKAIDQLNLNSIMQQDRKKMFAILDFDHNQEVLITTINNAFKFFDKQNKSGVSMPAIDDICEKILKALNCDEDYLNRELPKAQKPLTNGLELEDFVNFFMQMTKASDFLKSEELLYLGEHYSNDKGFVDSSYLLKRLLEVRMHRNLRKDTYSQGIHELPRQIQANNNPIMFNPILNQTMPQGFGVGRFATQAAQKFLQPPPGFRNNSDPAVVEAVIKALYIKNINAFQHFIGFQDFNQQIQQTHFISAIQALNINLQMNQIQTLFYNICAYGYTQSQAYTSADKIDEFLHFSCSKQYEMLHDELLGAVNTATKRFNMSFGDLLRNRHSGLLQQHQCTTNEIQSIINTLNPLFPCPAVDYAFLLGQYTHPTMPNFIQLQNLVQDVEQIPFKMPGTQPFGQPQYGQPNYGQQNYGQQNYGQPLNKWNNNAFGQPGWNQNNNDWQQNRNLEQKTLLIAQFLVQVGKTRFNLAEEFQRKERLSSKKGTVSVDHFKNIIHQASQKSLMATDVDFLVTQYVDRNNPNQIDYLLFLDDVKDQKLQLSGRQPQKDEESSKNKIMKIEMNDDPFIKIIKKIDIEQRGQLSERIDQVFEQLFQQNAANGTKFTKQQFTDGLVMLQIFLNTNDAQSFDRWFKNNSTGDRNLGQLEIIDIMDFFNQIDRMPAFLRNEKKKRQKVRTNILTAEELKDCHEVCWIINDELKRKGVNVDQQIQKYTSAGLKTIDHLAFQSLLKEIKLSAETHKRVLQDKKMLSNLIFYLASEKKNEVSLQKLRTALESRKTDQPLKQQCIDEELSKREKLTNQLMHGQVPAPVRHFVHWIIDNNTTIYTIFGVKDLPNIEAKQFLVQLEKSGYTEKQFYEDIINSCKDPVNRTQVSLKQLKNFFDLSSGIQSELLKKKQDLAIEPAIRQNFEKISKYLMQKRMTADEFFNQIDKGTGKISREEFIRGLTQQRELFFNQQQAARMFEALDRDNCGDMSRNEFNMHIEGIKRTKQEREANISKQVLDGLSSQIMLAFKSFDTDGNNQLDPQEMMRAMRGVGHVLDEKQAIEMIRNINKDQQRNYINYQEFENFFLPILKEKIFAAEDQTDMLRKLFKEADTDYSGFLEADELYNVMLKLKIDITFEELIEMLDKYDEDGNQQLSIDEFVQLMTGGADFTEALGSNSVYNKMQSSYQQSSFNFAEILAQQNILPENFVPSFFIDAKIKPSNSLKVQIDTANFQYKDFVPNVSQQNSATYLMSFESAIGCELLVETAEGIPAPKEIEGKGTIIRRALRVGLYNETECNLIFNCAMITAEKKADNASSWSFSSAENPVLFRSTAVDNLTANIKNYKFIFELVVFVKHENKNKEIETRQYSCGWAEAPLEFATRSALQKLDLQGGSPFTKLGIQSEYVEKEKSVLKNVFKTLLNEQSKSQISVKFTSKDKWQNADKDLVGLLPSTCFVNKNMMSFVVSYREYSAKLLNLQTTGPAIRPGGDVVLSCFTTIMDDPVIAEHLSKVWSEDFVKVISKEKSLQSQLTKYKEAMEDVVRRLWPILYSDEFKENHPIRPKVAGLAEENYLPTLIQSALRHGKTQAKADTKIYPPEQLTYFKPFNLRELDEFEMFDAIN